MSASGRLARIETDSTRESERTFKGETADTFGVDRTRLEQRLALEFDGDEHQFRIVARQARDLADSGQLAADLDVELTVETVVSNLTDAPADCALAERWNWWMDALTLSHGDYRRFRVRPDVIDGEN